MGKYSSLKKDLTRLELEPSIQEKVTAVKNNIRNSSGGKLDPSICGSVLINARMEKNRLEALIREQNTVITAMEQELIEFLDSADLLLMRMTNGVTLSINDDVYSQVSNKFEFHQWIRNNHLEDLFSVHYQTMSSMVKERLMNGDDIPPGITPYFKQTIRVRGIRDLERGGENHE